MPHTRTKTLVCRNCRSRKDISHFHILTDGKLIDYLCCECVDNPQIAEYFRAIMRDHPAKPLTQYGAVEIMHAHTAQPQLAALPQRTTPYPTEAVENPHPAAPKPQREPTISISLTLSRAAYRALAREADRQKTNIRLLIVDTMLTLYGDEEQSA